MRVICFDLGGVLVRICRDWGEAAAAAGLPFRDAERMVQPEARTQRSAVIDSYQRGELTCEQYYSAMSHAVFGLYSPQEVERVHEAWTLSEYPGISELVDELNLLPNVVTACLSNTSHSHWVRLASLDGQRSFPSVTRLRHQLASHLLRLTKPDPKIYVEAQRLFGAQPEQIVFFDDLEENVHSARQTGWNAEIVDHTGDTAAQMRAHLRAYGVAV
ncbi:MAG: hypothetical protein RJA70_2329 [Pseudomonadota bacterium]|jgi:putative hydrolase of the HAD superfamily